MRTHFAAHVLATYRKAPTVELDGEQVKLVVKAPRKKRAEGAAYMPAGREAEEGGIYADDAAFVAVLEDIWEHNEYQCGKLLCRLSGARQFAEGEHTFWRHPSRPLPTTELPTRYEPN
jgi:hypothetical protein